jgi:hypothetical protein
MPSGIGAAVPGIDLRRWERVLVVLIALHSLVVGVFLLFATEWGARFGGFGSVQPLFFPRQAGAFHFVVAAAYLIECFRYRGVSILLTTKSIAVVFLVLITLVDDVPWVVPISALGDALMGLAVFLLRRAITREARATPAGRAS